MILFSVFLKVYYYISILFYFIYLTKFFIFIVTLKQIIMPGGMFFLFVDKKLFHLTNYLIFTTINSKIRSINFKNDLKKPML